MNLIMHIIAAAGAQTSLKPGALPTPVGDSSTLKTFLSITFAVVGALALLMITVSGLRYILAGGDEQKIAKAKNGIVYSLVGVLVAIVATAIVSFVVIRL